MAAPNNTSAPMQLVQEVFPIKGYDLTEVLGTTISGATMRKYRMPYPSLLRDQG